MVNPVELPERFVLELPDGAVQAFRCSEFVNAAECWGGQPMDYLIKYLHHVEGPGQFKYNPKYDPQMHNSPIYRWVLDDDVVFLAIAMPPGNAGGEVEFWPIRASEDRKQVHQQLQDRLNLKIYDDDIGNMAGRDRATEIMDPGFIEPNVGPGPCAPAWTYSDGPEWRYVPDSDYIKIVPFSVADHLGNHLWMDYSWSPCPESTPAQEVDPDDIDTHLCPSPVAQKRLSEIDRGYSRLHPLTDGATLHKLNAGEMENTRWQLRLRRPPKPHEDYQPRIFRVDPQ